MIRLVQVPEQDQTAFDAAAAHRLAPSTWIPETWADLRQNVGKNGTARGFNRIDADAAPFVSPSSEDVIEMQRRIGRDSMGECPSPVSPPGQCRPSPFADFSHTDPSKEYDKIAEFLGAGPDAVSEVLERPDIRDRLAKSVDEPTYRLAIDVLKGITPPDAKKTLAVAQVLSIPDVEQFFVKRVKVTRTAFRDAVSLLTGVAPRLTPNLARLDALGKLRKMVGPDSPGMLRLAQVFDWVLCRATVLMNDLNVALAAANEADYNVAREDYLRFLVDLDDHEPEMNHTHLNISNKKSHSGYGRTMKWACFRPSIDENTGQILGVRVVVKWNPHSSSNGVPIPHDP